jgi:hypothetical protein
MAIALKGNALESASGQILCARSLNAPDHWWALRTLRLQRLNERLVMGQQAG